MAASDAGSEDGRWDLSKENLLPLREGRDIDALRAALSKSHILKDEMAQEFLSLKNRITTTTVLENKEDFIDATYHMICFLEKASPQGGRKLIKQFAKSCYHTVREDKRYHDNRKLMQILIKYIFVSGQPVRYVHENQFEDVFNYMYIEKIGTKYADFFIAWSAALEAHGANQPASYVLDKGIEMGAEPTDLLLTAKIRFEERMALKVVDELRQFRDLEPSFRDNDVRHPLQGSSISHRPQLPTIANSDAAFNLRKPAAFQSENSSSVSGRKNVEGPGFIVHAEADRIRPGTVPAAFTAAPGSGPTSSVIKALDSTLKENDQRPEQWVKPGKAIQPPLLNNSRLPAASQQRNAALAPKKPEFLVYTESEGDVSANSTLVGKPPICLGESRILRTVKPGDREDDISAILKTTVSSTTANAANIKLMFDEELIRPDADGEEQLSFEEVRAAFLALTKTDLRDLGAINRVDSGSTMDIERLSISAALPAVASNSIIGNTTKTDCIERILSMAYKDDRANPAPFGSASRFDDTTVVAEESGLWLGGGQQKQQVEASQGPRKDFSVFHDSCLAEQPSGKIVTENPATFSKQSLGKRKGLAVVSTEEDTTAKVANRKDFSVYNDSLQAEPAEGKSAAPASSQAAMSKPSNVCVKRRGLAPAPTDDESRVASVPQAAVPENDVPKMKHGLSQVEAFLRADIDDDDDDEPEHRQKNRPSFGVLDASGDLDLDDVPFGNNGRLSMTINLDQMPRFQSTQRVDKLLPPLESDLAKMVVHGISSEQAQPTFEIPHDSWLETQAPQSLQNRPPQPQRHMALRKSISKQRLNAMPPLAERSESSSSSSNIGAATTQHFTASASHLDVIRERSGTVLDDSGRLEMSEIEAPRQQSILVQQASDDGDEEGNNKELPTMNCEEQKSFHKINISRFLGYTASQSVLEQSGMTNANASMMSMIGDRTYSWVDKARDIDPTNPFADELVALLLEKYSTQHKDYIFLPDRTMPILERRPNRQSGGSNVVELAPGYSMTYSFNIGSGAFASIVAARRQGGGTDDKLRALKFQVPPCYWEIYIINESRRRLARRFGGSPSLARVILDMVPAIEKAVVYGNGSCLVLPFGRFGSLLNLVNDVCVRAKVELPEVVVALLTIDLLRVMAALHKCKIIHGDFKPDNVLFNGLPDMARDQPFGAITSTRQTTIQIIDYGRSIDIACFPPGTVFMAKVTTEGFDCIEMKTKRPWTYQTDHFGIAGTVHVLVFGSYMQVDFDESNAKWIYGRKKFKRSWEAVDLWSNLFDALLNIPDCEQQPNLDLLREGFERRFSTPESRAGYSVAQRRIMAIMNEAHRDIA